MADRSQSRDRNREAPARSRQHERPATRTPDAPLERPVADARSVADAMKDTARKGKAQGETAPAVTLQETVATVGASGEKNLAVKWIDVWIGNSKPCYFEVTTLPGHGVEVTVEQLAYKKTYTGVGSLTTQPVPVVPIGTKFTLISRDTTTGETLEQKGIWRDMGGGGSVMSLWALIKKLLWKSE